MSESSKTILVGALIFVLSCLIVAVALAILLMPAGPKALVPSPIPSGLGGSAPYQAFFTTPRFPDKESDHHGGMDERLTAFVSAARSSIDMAVYQLDLPNVTQALVDANKRGVRVRVVTDSDILEDASENGSFLQLQLAGIPVEGGNPNAIMHNKFVVVDRAAVWTGSWNFTVNDTYRYNNNSVIIQSPELAQNYTVTFEKMFTDKKFSGARKPGGTTARLMVAGIPVENYFSPENDVTGEILPRLKGANQSIDFIAFSFTDDTLGQAILERSRAGVKVRGVFEKTGSETQYSEYGRMRKSGLDVWQDGNGYLMHHKVIIIDDRTVIFGSFNFSKEANTENDENLLIIEDPALAATFEGEFTRVYEQAKAPPRK